MSERTNKLTFTLSYAPPDRGFLEFNGNVVATHICKTKEVDKIIDIVNYHDRLVKMIKTLCKTANYNDTVFAKQLLSEIEAEK